MTVQDRIKELQELDPNEPCYMMVYLASHLEEHHELNRKQACEALKGLEYLDVFWEVIQDLTTDARNTP